jgi:CRISPR-associated protein Csm4
VPRATIPRNGGDAEPYYIERLQFKEKVHEHTHKGGFYCLFEGDETAYKNVLTALNLLGEQGIGTDRNVGNGKFDLIEASEAENQVFEDLFTTKSDYYTNLSLFNPSSHQDLIALIGENTPHKNVGFELLKRGGWITTEPYMNLRKKAVFMFQEGSVFKSETVLKTAGQTINLRPEILKSKSHPIWRVGKSIFVPITFA